MKALVLYLVMSMLLTPVVWAQTKPGDQAKNLKLVPPWTMKLCPTELHATYGKDGAIKLRALDNDCVRWKGYAEAYPLLKKNYDTVWNTLEKIIQSHEKSRQLDQKRITDLVSQLKKEIEEKNEHKYKPSWNWLWVTVGGGLALLATGLVIGTYATK